MRKYLFIFAVLFFSAMAGNLAFAEGYTALAPIPGIAVDGEYSTDLGVFLNSIYNWGIGIVGILAFAQLTISGIQYMVSGAVDQKSAAKGRIVDALVGVGLALSAYLILNIINPNLLNIKTPDIKGTLQKLEEQKQKEEQKEQETQSALPSDEGSISKCLTYTELQSYVDNDYTCVLSPRPGTCTARDQGFFDCSPLTP